MFTMNETLASMKAGRKAPILFPGTKKSVNKINFSKTVFLKPKHYHGLQLKKTKQKKPQQAFPNTTHAFKQK